jgi:hypothetical protein
MYGQPIMSERASLKDAAKELAALDSTSKTRFFKLLRKAALQNDQPKPGKTTCRKGYLPLLVALLCAACAREPVIDDTGAGIVVVGEDATGFYFNQDGFTIWTDEGVPAKYFTAVVPPKKCAYGLGSYHITDAMWEQGKRIKLERRNMISGSLHPTPAAKPTK